MSDRERTENNMMDIGTFNIDVVLLPNGKYDTSISHDKNASIEKDYHDLSHADIGKLIVDYIENASAGAISGKNVSGSISKVNRIVNPISAECSVDISPKSLPVLTATSSKSNVNATAQECETERNCACKSAIAKATKNDYDVDSVRAEFSDERIAYILASTVQAQSNNVRNFGKKIKEWAETIHSNQEADCVIRFADAMFVGPFVEVFLNQLDEDSPDRRAQIANAINGEI
jgi:hypothetical protein